MSDEVKPGMHAIFYFFRVTCEKTKYTTPFEKCAQTRRHFRDARPALALFSCSFFNKEIFLSRYFQKKVEVFNVTV